MPQVINLCKTFRAADLASCSAYITAWVEYKADLAADECQARPAAFAHQLNVLCLILRHQSTSVTTRPKTNLTSADCACRPGDANTGFLEGFLEKDS